MKSLCLEKYGSLDLNLAELPTPVPGDGEVRIDIHASALNPADYKVALGEVKFLHGRRFPMVLGYDFSGVISAVGKNASPYNAGDEVFGFLPYGPSTQQGTFAEIIVAKVNQIALKPKSVSHAQAAASATSGLTAIQAMRDVGQLKSGGRVLITGASGGVGSVAIKVAQKLGASEIVAVGSGKGLELAKKMGAQTIIDRKHQDVLKSAEGPFDVVFDAAAAYRWSQWQTKLVPGGAFVTTLPSLPFVIDKLKSLAAKSAVAYVGVKSKSDDLRLLGSWLESGLQVPIESTVSIQEVGKSLERLKRGQVIGKVAVAIR